ncbi:hypothetical protein BCR35DRAFT_314304 [Leucosporidium creatinivorum]|uniref:J domain-containing protein n=1 Tax=Leucosporidium creatinivorum TaxID=106004 RepID=A0A1Y2F2L3_9BASI|nr:hypothetical protein BCR35DRAFT_314304 [Leucosporidium creatinivorum]
MSAAASSSKLPPTNKEEPVDDASIDALFDEGELERILSSEASLLTREQEVLRVIKAFKLNPYEILDLNWMPSQRPTESDIQKTYRKKSLLIHPDKLKHERGIEAFDLLKKAAVELADPTRRSSLDQTIEDARMLVLREQLKPALPPSTPDDDPRLLALGKEKDGKEMGDLKERVRRKTKEILIEEELRKRSTLRSVPFEPIRGSGVLGNT